MEVSPLHQTCNRPLTHLFPSMADKNWQKLTWHQSLRQKSRQRGRCLSADWADGRPYNVILQESLKANNIVAVIPNRDSQKIMDIYLNPKQKQKYHVPEEFLCESSEMKALMKRNFNLHKRRKKPLH